MNFTHKTAYCFSGPYCSNKIYFLIEMSDLFRRSFDCDEKRQKLFQKEQSQNTIRIIFHGNNKR